MNHLERMQAIRQHVDTIIDHTEALNALNALKYTKGSPMSVTFRTPRSPFSATDSTFSMALPIDELREILQRRIAEAEAEIRKLGMVAPSPPGSNVLGPAREGMSATRPMMDERGLASGTAMEDALMNPPRVPADLASPGS